jgi:hypothetical protein
LTTLTATYEAVDIEEVDDAESLDDVEAARC